MLMFKSTHQQIICDMKRTIRLAFTGKPFFVNEEYADIVEEVANLVWQESAEVKLLYAQIEDLRRQLADAKKRPRRQDGRFVSHKELEYGSDA